MDTKLFSPTPSNIKECGEILKNGGLVAIPTETVYGLAANALDGEAVKKIFVAKGRPQDNPLIVHIADFNDIYDLVSFVPDSAKKLADAFWGGPLTMILKKSDKIPNEVSAGLDTVAIRLPSHKIAKEIIKSAGVPLAAPSANLSGSPSPTTFSHVKNDLFGKVDAIIAGGECEVGVESTVITLAGEKPKILRPGGITREQIESVLGTEVEIDNAVLNAVKEGEKVSSPGMKYKHYAPKAKVYLIEGEGYAEFVNLKNGVALCFDEDLDKIKGKKISYGSGQNPKTLAHNLFNKLRELDDESLTVYAHSPEKYGVGLAVYNRLIRAAGFEVINLDDNRTYRTNRRRQINRLQPVKRKMHKEH